VAAFGQARANRQGRFLKSLAGGRRHLGRRPEQERPTSPAAVRREGVQIQIKGGAVAEPVTPPLCLQAAGSTAQPRSGGASIQLRSGRCCHTCQSSYSVVLKFFQ
jgi:hypothetical protein